MVKADMVETIMLLLLKLPYRERILILRKFCLICGDLRVTCECLASTARKRENKNVKY